MVEGGAMQSCSILNQLRPQATSLFTTVSFSNTGPALVRPVGRAGYSQQASLSVSIPLVD